MVMSEANASSDRRCRWYTATRSRSDGNTCRPPHRHPRAWVVALPDRLQDMEDPGLDRTGLPVRGLLPLGDPRWQYAAFPGQRDADRGKAALPGVQAPAVDCVEHLPHDDRLLHVV